MAEVNLGLFGSGKTITDQMQLQQAFELKKLAAIAQLQQAATGPDLPVNIREYGLFQQMSPEQQKAYTSFLQTKSPSFGGNFVLPDSPVPQPTPTQPAAVNQPIQQPVTTQAPTGFTPPTLNTKLSNGKAMPNPIVPVLNDKIDSPVMTMPPATAPKAEPRFFVNDKTGAYDIKGAPAGFAWADVGGKRQLSKLPGAPDEVTFKNENTLRDEFNTQTKDFRTVQDAYSKINQTSGTGAGDMSMLYAYVKLLDPGSVVRESEFATAAASGSLGTRVQGAVKSIMEGGRLPPAQRQEFLNEATNIYNGQKQGYDRTKTTYTDIAKRSGLNVENVITDYAPTSDGTTRNSNGSAMMNENNTRNKTNPTKTGNAPARTMGGKKYEKINGEWYQVQ